MSFHARTARRLVATSVIYLALAFPALCQAEGPYEPNDSLSRAAQIGSDPVPAALETSGDVDWYEVTLGAFQQVDFTVTFTTDRFVCQDRGFFAVTDEQGHTVSSVSFEKHGSRTFSYTTSKSSRYYVRIYGDYADVTGCAYTVQVGPPSVFVPADPVPLRVLETESNDTPTEAFGPINGSTIYEGGVAGAADVDRLFFYVKPNQAVTLELVGIPPCPEEAQPSFDLTRAGRSILASGEGYWSDDWRSIVRFKSGSREARYDMKFSEFGEGGCRWAVLVKPDSAITNTLTAGPPAVSATCVSSRTRRARWAHLVSQSKRDVRDAATASGRRRAKRRLRARRQGLRRAIRKTKAACDT